MLGASVPAVTDESLRVPAPPPEIAPAFVPGEPAEPEMRPLAFGWRLASLLPGLVMTEPPTLGPGEALGLLPGEATAPAAACASRSHWSKSFWVWACATAPAASSAAAAS